MSEYPTLTVEQVVAALRARPEGATEDDIRKAATPGEVMVWPDEDREVLGDPLSGPATRRLVWPDWAKVHTMIDLAREAGWAIEVIYASWDNARNAPVGPTRWRLAAEPPVTVQQAAKILGLTYQGADYLLRTRQVQPVRRVGTTRLYSRADVQRLAMEWRRPGRPTSKPDPHGEARIGHLVVVPGQRVGMPDGYYILDEETRDISRRYPTEDGALRVARTRMSQPLDGGA